MDTGVMDWGENSHFDDEMARALVGGPFPSPTLLKEYEDYYPGAAAKLLELARERSEHRLYLEEQYVRLESDRLKFKIQNATLFAIACIIVSAAFVGLGLFAIAANDRVVMLCYVCAVTGFVMGCTGWVVTQFLRLDTVVRTAGLSESRYRRARRPSKDPAHD